MFYVLIIGSYDQSFVGPFLTAKGALAFASTVPSNFESIVMSKAEYEANVAAYGALPVQAKPLEIVETI